jgi:hypothetical protein
MFRKKSGVFPDQKSTFFLYETDQPPRKNARAFLKARVQKLRRIRSNSMKQRATPRYEQFPPPRNPLISIYKTDEINDNYMGLP